MQKCTPEPKNYFNGKGNFVLSNSKIGKSDFCNPCNRLQVTPLSKGNVISIHLQLILKLQILHICNYLSAKFMNLKLKIHLNIM